MSTSTEKHLMPIILTKSAFAVRGILSITGTVTSSNRLGAGSSESFVVMLEFSTNNGADDRAPSASILYLPCMFSVRRKKKRGDMNEDDMNKAIRQFLVFFCFFLCSIAVLESKLAYPF